MANGGTPVDDDFGRRSVSVLYARWPLSLVIKPPALARNTIGLRLLRRLHRLERRRRRERPPVSARMSGPTFAPARRSSRRFHGIIRGRRQDRVTVLAVAIIIIQRRYLSRRAFASPGTARR